MVDEEGCFYSWDNLFNYFKTNLIGNLESENQVLNTMTEQLKIQNQALDKNLEDIRRENQRLENANQNLGHKLAEQSGELNSMINYRVQYEKTKEETRQLQNKLEEQKRVLDVEQKKILDCLKPLERINRTFFGDAGNKGKGELGELHIKKILETSGLSSEYWTENLQIGKTQKNVEFAIFSGKNGKWIPIDSKVIEGEYDEEDNIIIDDKYKNKILAQVKKIKEYTNKSNTTAYALLVLQSDKLYMSLFEKYSGLFTVAIQEHNVYIGSPSLFIQYAWNISSLLNLWEQTKNSNELFADIHILNKHVFSLVNALSKSHDSFNTAMVTHYPNVKKKIWECKC